MSRKKANETKNVARCDTCLFGRGIRIEDKNRKGEVIAVREMCECHVSRPTRYGFPVVRRDDYCAYHVDAATCERTFAGLTATTTCL